MNVWIFLSTAFVVPPMLSTLQMGRYKLAFVDSTSTFWKKKKELLSVVEYSTLLKVQR